MGMFDYPGMPETSGSGDEKRMVFMEGCTSEQWKKIFNIVEHRPFLTGDILINEGDEDDSFYILTDGSAEVVVGKGDTESVIATIDNGSVFGEIAFFDGQPRSAVVRAREQGHAARITREKFDRLAAWEPVLARQMLFDLGKILSARLRYTTRR